MKFCFVVTWELTQNIVLLLTQTRTKNRSLCIAVHGCGRVRPLVNFGVRGVHKCTLDNSLKSMKNSSEKQTNKNNVTEALIRSELRVPSLVRQRGIETINPGREHR